MTSASRSGRVVVTEGHTTPSSPIPVSAGWTCSASYSPNELKSGGEAWVDRCTGIGLTSVDSVLPQARP